MDRCGRTLTNVFCERLWRSDKYENIYLNQYDSVHQLQIGLTAYFAFHNIGNSEYYNWCDDSFDGYSLF